MRKEKEQGYRIFANNDLSEQNFAILQDALSHMGEATVYQAAAEDNLEGTRNRKSP